MAELGRGGCLSIALVNSECAGDFFVEKVIPTKK